MTLFSTIIRDLAGDGIAVVRDFVPRDTIAALRGEALRRDGAEQLISAATGRGASRRVRMDVRGDRIGWIEEAPSLPAERALLATLEALRVALNRELVLGLWCYEGHYALYPPGARYARHRDRFADDDARALSLVLYLNEAWQPDDGGALRIHHANGTARDVLPEGGTLAVFLAADFEHEVLPAVRPRLAVTGWFRTREK